MRENKRLKERPGRHTVALPKAPVALSGQDSGSREGVKRKGCKRSSQTITSWVVSVTGPVETWD